MDTRTPEEKSEQARQAALAGAERRRRQKLAQEDPELAAMHTLADAFSDLDPVSRHRVLNWAQERYVRAPLTVETDGLHKFMHGLAEAGRTMGNMTGEDILRAALTLQALAQEADEPSVTPA